MLDMYVLGITVKPRGQPVLSQSGTLGAEGPKRTRLPTDHPKTVIVPVRLLDQGFTRYGHVCRKAKPGLFSNRPVLKLEVVFSKPFGNE